MKYDIDEEYVEEDTKLFECLPRCEFPKIESYITFHCDKCIKNTLVRLTEAQKEKILVILNE